MTSLNVTPPINNITNIQTEKKLKIISLTFWHNMKLKNSAFYINQSPIINRHYKLQNILNKRN